jgi:cytochrome c
MRLPILLAVIALLCPLPAAAQTAGDAARGAKLYQQRCTACHSLDANRIGPLHRGVFGRRSAGVSGYAYSDALKGLNVVWNAQTLDKWLTNPPAMARGTAMGIRVSKPQDRADLIAYLKSVSPPAKTK